jgi:hypothetical protein
MASCVPAPRCGRVTASKLNKTTGSVAATRDPTGFYWHPSYLVGLTESYRWRGRAFRAF